MYNYDFFGHHLPSFFYIGSAHRLSVNSRKKRFVNPIKIEVTQRARMETILGKSPAILNGHQPPRADYPYVSYSPSGPPPHDMRWLVSSAH